MPRPLDIMANIHPQNPDFRVGGWEIEFGIWQWFYVAGMRTLMSRARVYNKSDLYDHISEAVNGVPATWTASQPNGEWGELSQSQVKRAINGAKMRFDKAVLSVLCLEFAIRAAGSELDIYDFIEIRPAMFRLDRYTEVFPTLTATNIAELQEATHQPRPEVFTLDMKQGRAVTYPTAAGVNKKLTPRHRDLSLFLIQTKRESLGTPSHYEQPMFP